MKTRSLQLKISLILMLIGVISITFFTDCGQRGKKEGYVDIGAILPLTGNLARIGEPKKNAIDIALIDINSNQNNHIKINVFYEDSRGNPRDGLSAFQKILRTTNTQYFYVDLTPVVNIVAPLVNDEEVVVFAGSAQPEVTDLSPWIFRLFAGGEQEIEMINDYLQRTNTSSIFVLHSNEIYGSTAFGYLKNLFEKSGGVILGKDDYPLDIKDTRNILLRAKQAKADKIVVLGYGVEFPGILKQMRELEIPISNVVTNLGATNTAVMALPEEFINGLTFVGPRFAYLLQKDQLTAKMQDFVNEYERRFSEIPDFRSAYVYDTFIILSSVFEVVGVNNLQAVAEELIKIKDFEGVSGMITFKENGDSYTDLILAKYYNREIVLID